jgi:hypothetical protein
MQAVSLKISKSTFVSFKKISTKIIGVDNVELYQCAKSQFKIHCILVYTKIIKMIIFRILKMCAVHHPDPHICHLFLHVKCNEFRIGFCTLVDFIIIHV